MTPEQHILLQIYATQKVYLHRLLEITCAIKETQETGKEPTGLMHIIASSDANALVDQLVRELTDHMPDAINYGFATEGDPDGIAAWFNRSVNKVFNEDDNKDGESE